MNVLGPASSLFTRGGRPMRLAYGTMNWNRWDGVRVQRRPSHYGYGLNWTIQAPGRRTSSVRFRSSPATYRDPRPGRADEALS
jgi:hypothetical protein